MNQKIAEVYQTNEVNPLAGCLPSLVQIPVFIGLYRAVLNLAKENALDEPFLFLPNLEGPTYGADPAHGSDWLFKNWVDGVPSLGWENTLAYVSIPIFLTVSQVISMNLMQPKSDDPQQQQANVILKFLPFMVGWFALNVPAALGIYWVVNNVVTTATTLYVRSIVPKVDMGSGGGGAVMEATTTSTVDFNPTPMNERAVGFGSRESESSDDGMKTLTAVDAEVVDVMEEEIMVPDRPDIPGAPKGKKVCLLSPFFVAILFRLQIIFPNSSVVIINDNAERQEEEEAKLRTQNENQYMVLYYGLAIFELCS